MAKTNKKAAAKSVSNIMQAPTLNANTYAAHNICPKNGVTPAQVLAWVQQHANGNLANVQKQTGGKGRVANATGGVRQTGLALAYNGGNLANVQKQTKAAKLGGNWLWFTVALLNGGGKRTSAAHWGTSNVQLVVQPTAS